MTVVVAMHGQPFYLDRPFRWQEPYCGDPMTADPLGTMVFSTEVTLGFAGGDTNLYRRVGNSPINATDPSGNAANVVAGGVGAGVGAIFGAGAYLYQYSTGGIEKFRWWDMGAYALGGAAAGGVAGLTFGGSLMAAGGLGLGTVGTTAVAGGVTGLAAGATGGLVTGVGSTVDDAWRGDATWGQVGMAGLSGMGRGAFFGGIAGTVGGAAFPIVASLTGGGIAGGFIAGSGSAMVGDFSSQLAGIAVGLQSHFDPGQTALAVFGGGVLGGYGGYRNPRLGGLVGSGAWREAVGAISHPISTVRSTAASLRGAFASANRRGPALNIAGISTEDAVAIESRLMEIPGAKSVRVFGSRTMGTSSARSDLDVALFGDIDLTTSRAQQAIREAQAIARRVGIGTGKGYRPLDVNVFASIPDMWQRFVMNPGFDPRVGLPVPRRPR
jgi:predicted nucleotidyltransferase